MSLCLSTFYYQYPYDTYYYNRNIHTDCCPGIIPLPPHAFRTYHLFDMAETGLRVGADCIVTRNLKDYKLSVLPVLSPERFLEEIAKVEEMES